MTKIPPATPPILHRHLKQASLSYSQESLWFLQQLDPENTSYNSNHLVKFTGGIDRHLLEQALNELVRRHEPLRTLYPNQAGSPLQVVQPFEPVSIMFEDFSGLPANEQEPAIHRYASELNDQPFDLQRGPLTRFALLNTGPNVDYLFFCTHHINFDAWSWHIFLSELMQFYGAFRSGNKPGLSELPIQYADYALWQREWLSGETLQAYVEHWKNILSGNLPVLELPTDRPRPVLQTFRGARFQFPLSRVLSSQMKGFCQKERMTPFQLLLAAYAVLLMRHTGQEDIIIGCPFANRSRSEMEAVVGLFVNPLPIRVNLQGNPAVRDFLKHVQSVMLEAYPWQAAPFEALVSEISPQRDLSRTPVFQVTINLRNVPMRQVLVEGLEMEKVQQENDPAPFDLSLDFNVGVDGELDASFQYNVDLYNENTIALMSDHYQNLLADLLAKSDGPISDLEMLTASELKRVTVDWNPTETDFPQVCIQDLISGQAERNPGALAVVCNGNSLTYADLETKANQLAHCLRANSVGADSRVGFYLPRSEMLVVSQLAILKAGGAFVPFDLTYPKERISFMVKDSDPVLIITEFKLRDQLPDGIKKIFLDTESKSIEACESGRPVSITDNKSQAYIIYTSGSTGRPKGTINTHKGVVNYLTSMIRDFQFGTSDRVLQFSSLSFDASVWSILGTLSYGGTVYLLDDDQMRNPDFILAAIISHQATYFDLVPTTLRAICESAPALEKNKNNLRLITIGGEVLREADVKLARRVFGDSVELVNQYGPTECSIWATNYRIPEGLPNDLQVVPVGKPVNNVRIYVLDNYYHPVPQGVKGELFIGGVGVGGGYWNRPDLTAERYLPDPFMPDGWMYRTGDIVRQLPDGLICFLGRSDDQVKIRGNRVELSEIEALVNEFSGVKDAAVVLWRNDVSEILTAYITLLECQQEYNPDDLRDYLGARLPTYMLPSSILTLDKMPLTPNGKIDRRALPHPENHAETDRYLAPRNDIETRLVSIWKEILGVERVGVRDNFFESGGHSLLAVRLFARIQEEFGQSLPLLLIFKDGTVEALAEALTRKESLDQGIMSIQPEGDRLPIFIITPGLEMREFALTLGVGQPVYALNPVENGKIVYRKSVRDTAKILFRNLVDFYPRGPYLLMGYSASGYYTVELARLLIQNGREVDFVGLLDTYAPGGAWQVDQVDRAKFHMINLKGKSLPEILQYIGGSIQRFSIRLRRRGTNAKKIERYEQKGQVMDVRTLLTLTYKPEPFEGKVTLFSATSLPIQIHGDPMEGWTHIFSGQFEIVPVPGDHSSLLKPPHVAVLAGKIKEQLPRHENG